MPRQVPGLGFIGGTGMEAASSLVVVGDVIQVSAEDGYLRGHGTQVVDGQLVATVCGAVERVNKLIFVKPFGARYEARIGDVVIGRITEVAQKRWKVDVNSKHDAQLMLSAVNLPGGIQRRRTAVDELNMRALFVESDLISAEVQAVHQDGSVHLHTRSLKYGKLLKGQLVKVPPYLIKRVSQHFQELKQYGLGIIFGCNGYVWISSVSQKQAKEEQEQEEEVSLIMRERICRIANAIRVLSCVGSLISPDSVIACYEASIRLNIDIRDMLSSSSCMKIIGQS